MNMDDKIDKIIKIYTWTGVSIYVVVFISTLAKFF